MTGTAKISIFPSPHVILKAIQEENSSNGETIVLLISFIGTIVIIALLALILKIRHQSKLLTNRLALTESALDKMCDTERQLRNEITLQQKKLQRGMEDPITHLLGWQLFEDRLNQNIKESARYQLTMGILVIDIDDFKVINDALNYEVGDALLREIATRLQSCIRQVDSVSRYSKDTFVVILSQLSKPETAAVVAQRILHSLAQPVQIKEHELFITACIGIAIYPADGTDAASLLRSGNQALHLAKEKGKHVHQFYQERLHAKSQRELSLYNSLSRESIFREFIIYYQPIMDVNDQHVMAMNALLHWQNADVGLIRPQELFGYAEKQRKLNAISEWLIKTACQQFMHWRSLGFTPPLLAIPICLKQLETTHFIYRISQILQESKLPHECLLLEIKESTTQLPFDILEKAFNMLKYLNVKLALDNFGLGSFSIGFLKNLQVDYLKLDSSVTEDVLDNKRTADLVKSINFLADNLQMQVIAQGVESQQQIKRLKELGCHLMQGRCFGEPLEEDKVVEKMTVSAH